MHFDGGECAAEDEDFVAKAQRRRSRTVINMGEAAMLRAAPVGVPMVGVPEAEATEAEAAEAEGECAAEDEDFVARAQRRRSRTILSHDEARVLHAAPEEVGIEEEAGEAGSLHPISLVAAADDASGKAWGEVHVARQTCRPRLSQRMSIVEEAANEDEELAELERARGVSVAGADSHLERLSTHEGPEVVRRVKADETADAEPAPPKRRSSVGAAIATFAVRLFRRASSGAASSDAPPAPAPAPAAAPSPARSSFWRKRPSDPSPP